MNKLRKPYTGLDIIIKESKNKTLINVEGKIIEETKNTFKIKTKEGNKTVLKKACTFKINNQKIDGKKINKKPQDRIKTKL